MHNTEHIVSEPHGARAGGGTYLRGSGFLLCTSSSEVLGSVAGRTKSTLQRSHLFTLCRRCSGVWLCRHIGHTRSKSLDGSGWR